MVMQVGARLDHSAMFGIVDHLVDLIKVVKDNKSIKGEAAPQPQSGAPV